MSKLEPSPLPRIAVDVTTEDPSLVLDAFLEVAGTGISATIENGQAQVLFPEGTDVELIRSKLSEILLKIPAQRPPVVDPLDRLQVALEGANTIADLRNALSEYVTGEKKARPPKFIHQIRTK